MGYINRVGDVTQPFADRSAFLIGRNAAGTSQNYDREQDQYAYSLIQAIGHTCFTADARHGEYHDNGQAAPPETAPEVYG